LNMDEREDDEGIFRQRLLAKETQLKRAAKKFVLFQNTLLYQPPEKWIEAKQTLSKELFLYQFSMNKTHLVCTTAEKQLENYSQELKIKDEEINKVQIEIEKLKEDLQKEKENRKNKEEYETIAKVINSYPPRQQTEREIQELNQELELLSQEAASTTSRFDLRTKQLQLLLYAVHQLQQTLEEEKSQVEPIEVESNKIEEKEFDDRTTEQVTEMSIDDMQTDSKEIPIEQDNADDSEMFDI